MDTSSATVVDVKSPLVNGDVSPGERGETSPTETAQSSAALTDAREKTRPSAPRPEIPTACTDFPEACTALNGDEWWSEHLPLVHENAM